MRYIVLTEEQVNEIKNSCYVNIEYSTIDIDGVIVSYCFPSDFHFHYGYKTGNEYISF